MGGGLVIGPLLWQVNLDRAITLVEIAAKAVESLCAIVSTTYYNYRVLYIPHFVPLLEPLVILLKWGIKVVLFILRAARDPHLYSGSDRDAKAVTI